MLEYGSYQKGESLLVGHCLAGQAGSRPAPGRVARPPCRPPACSRSGLGRPQDGGFGLPPRPSASPLGRGQAGSSPASSATLPAQGQPRLGSGRPLCSGQIWQAGQAGSRPGLGRPLCAQQKASNGSIIGEGYLSPFTHLQPASKLNIEDHHYCKLKFDRSPNPSTQIRRSLED